MAKSSDIIKIGFDYRASLEQFERETNGVFDGISKKAGKQKISIQLDAKNDKVIEKIKELQKLKLDKFTFEFGESGLKEQLKTFEQLEKKINEIIGLSKGGVKISSDSSTTAIKEESKAMEKVAENAEKASKGKEKFTKANKKVKESADSSGNSIKEEDKYLKDLSKSITKYQKDLDKVSAKPTEDNRSFKLQEKIDKISDSITRLKQLESVMNDSNYVFNPKDIELGNELESTIKANIQAIKNMSAAEKGSTEDSRWKEIRKIRAELEANSKFSKEAREQLEHYIDVLKSGDPSVNVKEIHTAWTKVADEEIRAGRAGKSFFDLLRDKSIGNRAAQLVSYYLSFTDFIRYGKAIIDNVREIDIALTELRKVSDASESRLTQNFKNSAEAAKDLGATVSDLISATADWSRMGYSVDDSEELARISTLYKNVGDGINIEDANNSLISTLQGYQLVASEAESVVDKFNEVSNNFAITSGGIGEALQRSAASFNAANTDLSKSIALVTATRLQKLVEYMETCIKNIFNCHRSLYYYTPQYRGNHYMMV